MKTVIASLLLCVLAAHGQQSLYIDTHLPNSHPLKKELADKLKQSGKVVIVTLPEKADLILDLEQTGRGVSSCSGSIFFSGACGNRGRAVLKNRQTGDELWSEEKGGARQMSGWSAGMVGRKLGDDVVRFLKNYVPSSEPGTKPVGTSEAAETVTGPSRTPAGPPMSSAEPGTKPVVTSEAAEKIAAPSTMPAIPQTSSTLPVAANQRTPQKVQLRNAQKASIGVTTQRENRYVCGDTDGHRCSKWSGCRAETTTPKLNFWVTARSGDS
jgi:hypothetical protein